MQISFENHINKNLSFLKGSRLLLAVSGGIDSIVLTHLCYKLNLNIALAHCNFNLRNSESDADEQFVVELAEDLNLEAFVESFDTKAYAEKNKRSIQMAARELRYHWFEALAKQLQFDYILTAHHADDNLETFLINFTRGTGLEGLTGIPEVNDNFVRPLLPFSSHEIYTYAKENKIKWRDDSSNASVKYLRNKLRHEVIPILKEINPSLLQSFKNTLSNLQDANTIIKDKIEDLIKSNVIKQTDKGYQISISELKTNKNPKAYLYELFKDYGFTEWNDVAGLLEAQSGKQVFSATHRLIKDREHLLLSEINEEEHTEIMIYEDDKQVETPLGILCFDKANTVLHNPDKNIIYVDKALLDYPLILRQPKQGDIFFPLGMVGKKKLSKYLKDEKLSLLDKENTLVLCSGNTIFWVVNRRADNRFKITAKTKEILKIELQK